jgi:type I restriction enzyme S subunit
VGLKPGFKQTEVGVIPEDWEVAPVDQAFEVCNSLRLPLSQAVRERMAGPYPYYGPTSIQGYINEYRVQGEYVLIGEDGDHFLKWRERSMTLLVRGKFNVNNHAHLVRGGKNYTGWFYHYFAHKNLTPYLTRQGAGRYKLTKATLLNIPCALPPRPEQQAIVNALKDADALIESLEQLLAKKRRLKQGAMRELLRPKAGWVVKRLGSVLSFQVGFPFSSAFFNIESQGHRLVKNRDLKSDDQVFFYNGQSDPDFMVTNGDVLVGMDGDFLPCLWTKGPALLNQRVGRIVGSAQLDLVFAYYFLMHPLKEIENATSSTTVKHLSHSDILDLELPLPSPDEQTAIAAILSDMDAEIAALEAKLAKARQIKQGMMHNLLTGRIRLI